MVEPAWLIVFAVSILLSFPILLWRRVNHAEKKSHFAITGVTPGIDTFVMVMGASAGVGGPSNELKARLDAALDLEELIQPRSFFLFGGVDTVDEAETMRNYLLDAGVNHRRLHADSSGSNTRISIQRFAESVGAFHNSRLLAVSSGYHALRIVKQSKKFGLDVVVIAPRNSPETQNTSVRRIRIASEVLAIIWYMFPDWMLKRVNTGTSSLRHRLPKYLISSSSSKNSKKVKNVRE